MIRSDVYRPPITPKRPVPSSCRLAVRKTWEGRQPLTPRHVTCTATSASIDKQAVPAPQRAALSCQHDAELAVCLERALLEHNTAKYLTETSRARLSASSTAQANAAVSKSRHASQIEQQHLRFLQNAVDRQQTGAALALLQLLPSNVTLWSYLLKAIGATGDLDRLGVIIKARTAAGFPEDAYTASAIIAAAGKAGNKQIIVEVVSEAWTAGFMSKVVGSAAIHAFARCGDTQAAFRVHADMLQSGIHPDTRVFNALIHAAGQQQLHEEAKSFYCQLVAMGLHPTAHTFSLLFQAFCSGSHNQASWLLEVASSMASRSGQVNEFVIVSMLNALRNTKLKRGQVSNVAAKISTFLGQHRWNGSAYGAMLAFCADFPEVGLGLVRSIWARAQQARCHIDPLLASALFSACAACASAEALPLVRQAHGQLEVFQRHHSEVEQQQQAHARPRLRSQNRHGDLIVSYNALLCAYCGCQSLTEAESAYRAMPSKGIAPNLTTINTLLHGYAQAGQIHDAFRLLEGLRKKKMAPNAITFGSLMHACATAGDLSSAQTLLQDMKSAGVQPNAEIYTSLINAHVRTGTEEALMQAFQAFDDMCTCGVEPTAATYTCLITACQQLSDADRAFDLYRQSCTQGLKEDSAVLDSLIQICAKMQRLDEGVELVKQLGWSHGRDEHAQGLDALAGALAGASLDKALRMLSLLRTRGGRPSRSTLLRLMSACARSSRCHEGRRLYWELRQQGLEPSVAAGSNVIVALCCANRPLQALRIFDDMMQSKAVPAKLSGMQAGAPADASSDVGREAAEPERWQQGAAAPGREDDEASPAIPPPPEPLSVPGSIRIMPEVGEPEAMLTRDLERWVCARAGTRDASRAVTPHVAALAALVQTLAADGHLQLALPVYGVLRRQGRDAVFTVVTAQPMWQALIEACCRQNHLTAALKVFDDWKAFTQRRAASRRKATHARLSNVTLAFLEACCRSSSAYAWRVFDVCAEMRHQSELRREARLPHPSKASHHFFDAAKLS